MKWKISALMVARIPHLRKLYNRMVDDHYKIIMKYELSSPEKWDAKIQEMKQNGYHINEELKYEDFMKSLYRNGFSVYPDHNEYFKQIMNSVDILIPMFAQRRWHLLKTLNSDDKFICSDNPVTLRWSNKGNTFFSPGFGLTQTEVHMPINNRYAILGVFENISELEKYKLLIADKNIVADFNAGTSVFATRFIYSSNENFIWKNREGQIVTTSDFVSFLESQEGNAI